MRPLGLRRDRSMLAAWPASSAARTASAYSAPSDATYEIVPGRNPGSSYRYGRVTSAVSASRLAASKVTPIARSPRSRAAAAASTVRTTLPEFETQTTHEPAGANADVVAGELERRQGLRRDAAPGLERMPRREPGVVGVAAAGEVDRGRVRAGEELSSLGEEFVRPVLEPTGLLPDPGEHVLPAELDVLVDAHLALCGGGLRVHVLERGHGS